MKPLPPSRRELSRRSLLRLGLGTAAGLALGPALLVPSAAHAAGGKNISYGRNRLDIYTPNNASNAPVLVFVHGGAWKAGSKERVGSKARHYTDRGFVFVSVGYTLYPSANAEQQAVEVAQAINWVKANIGRHGGDGGRVAVMGHSAGCHLSSLAVLSGAATPRLLVCNDTGAYDLDYLAKLNGGSIPNLYSALDRRDKWKRWSPISYVGNRAQPPAMVIWSGGRNRDKISENFIRAMRAAGNSVTAYDGSAYSHMSVNSAIGKSNALTAAIDRFLAQM